MFTVSWEIGKTNGWENLKQVRSLTRVSNVYEEDKKRQERQTERKERKRKIKEEGKKN